MFLRELWLEAAPALAVTRNRNLALHRYAHALERLVVIEHPVVHIHEWCSDIAITLIRNIRWQFIPRA